MLANCLDLQKREYDSSPAAALAFHRTGGQALDKVLLEEVGVIAKSSPLHDDTKAKTAMAAIRTRLLDHRGLLDELVGQGCRPRNEEATSS